MNGRAAKKIRKVGKMLALQYLGDLQRMPFKARLSLGFRLVFPKTIAFFTGKRLFPQSRKMRGRK